MANAVILPGERLAGLQIDMLQKFRSGARTLDELDMFLKGKNPFEFERNEHGHIVLTFVGLDFTGAQEIERLESAGFRFGKYAKQCLTSTNPDSYDAKHRLVAGQMHKVALMPGREIEVDYERTTANLWKLGKKYGYGKPLGGHIPRIRETVSDKQMKEMGVWYIASLHDYIKDADGRPHVLYANRRRGDGRWVHASWVYPGVQWPDDGTFAFPVPAN